MIQYVLKKNINEKMPNAYGKFFAYPVITQTYDIDQLGQQYLFTNQDNVFLAWKRQKDERVSYRRLNSLTYKLELENNFSVTATVANDRQESSRVLGFQLSSPVNPADASLNMPLPGFNETTSLIHN